MEWQITYTPKSLIDYAKTHISLYANEYEAQEKELWVWVRALHQIWYKSVIKN